MKVLIDKSFENRAIEFIRFLHRSKIYDYFPD